jgi:hypothetical protein
MVDLEGQSANGVIKLEVRMLRQTVTVDGGRLTANGSGKAAA